MSSSSSSNSKNSEEEHEDEYEEALSLRDLPTSEETLDESKQEKVDCNNQEEFNFGGSFSTESKMCAADEVFFQGQILPKTFTSNTSSRCFSRSESNQSTDHFTSRSSSINSHRSSSSGSSSSFSTAAPPPPPPRRPKLHNQFQFSHPSPKPKPHFPNPSFKNGTKPPSPSTIWSFLRVGLVAPPPEIKLRSKSSGSSSRNSTSSTIGDKKQSGKLAGKNRVLFSLSGCSCTANAVVSAPLNAVTRNPTAKEDAEEDNSVELKKKHNDDEKKSGATRKQSVSRHRRTFEWLKQLSLEEAAAAAAVTVIDGRNQQ